MTTYRSNIVGPTQNEDIVINNVRKNIQHEKTLHL